MFDSLGSCSNGLFCDGSETCDPVLDCQAGISPPVDDGVGCTDDSCDEASDLIVNAANAANCDDGDACTAESCDEILGCAHDPIPDCEPPTFVPAIQHPWILIITMAFTMVGASVARRRRR